MMEDLFKTISLNIMIDKHIGERGTEKRETFEQELNTDPRGKYIEQIVPKSRKHQSLYLPNKTNTMKEGILVEKDINGELTSLTIDLHRHQDTIPALPELGFLEEGSFEERWKSALTIEEAKASIFQHVFNTSVTCLQKMAEVKIVPRVVQDLNDLLEIRYRQEYFKFLKRPLFVLLK